jgi:transcriptional regulator with XRE-family HTH domain
MLIGERLRILREEKELSQGDVEKRTGLLRCCISRVENGHTVPAVETLEKFARALEIPLYQLFYEGRNRPEGSSASQAEGTGGDPPRST